MREVLSTSDIRRYKEGEIESTRHYKWMSDGFAIFAATNCYSSPALHFLQHVIHGCGLRDRRRFGYEI
jgi:hypothetical protein